MMTAVLLLFACWATTLVEGRIAFTSQSPTYPDSAQSTPYVGFHITPDDVLPLEFSEIVRFQAAGGGAPDVYEVYGSIPYVEYDIVLDGYAPRAIRMEQSTTLSADTLGMEDTTDVPTEAAQVVAPRSTGRSARPHAMHAASAVSDDSQPSYHRQIKSFVAKRDGRRGGPTRKVATPTPTTTSPLARHLLGITHKATTSDDGSAITNCLLASNSAREIYECTDRPTNRVSDVASRLAAQSLLITQMKNFGLRMAEGLKSLNGTFTSLLENLEAQLALDEDQSDFFDTLVASLKQIEAEDRAAKAALEASREAINKHNEYGQNVTILAINEAAALANLQATEMVGEATEQTIIRHFLNSIYELTTQSHALLAFQSEQATFGSSVTRGQAEIQKAMARNDQTRAAEIIQQNIIRERSRLSGWVPWIFNEGQEPVEQLPTASHVETLGFSDYYWVDPSGAVMRDHHTLLCDVQQLVQNFRTVQISTFIDLFSMFSSRACFGAHCVCRMHRSRHQYNGTDAARVAALVAPFPTDSYASDLRNWLTTGNWTQTLAEPVPVESVPDASCSYSEFDPAVDPFFCGSARFMDHATPVSHASFDITSASARQQALSTARWQYVSATWFSSVSEVSTLLRDQCLTATHSSFPWQQRLSMHVTPWTLQQPESPASRTYCNTAFDTLTTSYSMGRPFMLLAMQEAIGFHRAWRPRRQAALQAVFDGYAASPQIVDSQPFLYELAENNTVPVLLKARHMYSVSVSPDAEAFQTLVNRRSVRGLEMRRLLVDPTTSPCHPTCTHSDYQPDPSFVPIRLGTTLLREVESVSGLDSMPGSLKWMGYGKCLYEACPLRVLNMTRETPVDLTRPIGLVSGVQHAANNQGSQYVGWRYVLDTSDARTVASTSEGALRDSDTYGFMPIGKSSAFDAASSPANRANPFGAKGADGVQRRFLSPSLYEWTQVHRGDMDPRRIGTGVGSYAVQVESLPGNPFNIKCVGARGAVSDKCAWLDKTYVDFDVERGTARFYARNWNLQGLLPMPDQGNILLSILTACPEDVQVHSELLLQSAVQMTNTVFKPNQYVYITATQCGAAAPNAATADAAADSATAGAAADSARSIFVANGQTSSNQGGSLLDAILGHAWAVAIGGSDGGGGAAPPPLSVQERSMTSWIPYQTHTVTVAGCFGQQVEVFGATQALAADVALATFVADADLFAAYRELPAATYALVADPQSEANTTAVGIAFAAVQAKAIQLVRDFVGRASNSTVMGGGVGSNNASPTVAVRAATRCMRWKAGDTVVSVRDVESTVISQTQTVRDDISAAFRSVQTQLNFAQSQSFATTQAMLNDMFRNVDLATLESYRIAVETVNAENAATQATLQRVLASSNANAEANRILIARGKAAQEALMVPTDAIAGMLTDLEETTQLRKDLLVEQAGKMQLMREALANFSAKLDEIDRINFQFNPPLDLLPADLARTLAFGSLRPCPLDTMEDFDNAQLFYNSDNSWFAGPLRPLRAFLVSLGILVLTWLWINKYVGQWLMNTDHDARKNRSPSSRDGCWGHSGLWWRTGMWFNCGSWWFD
jgi:hypothetical protein